MWKLVCTDGQTNRPIPIYPPKLCLRGGIIIATDPCITNQLWHVNTICRRSWYIAAHIWKIYYFKIEVVPFIINFNFMEFNNNEKKKIMNLKRAIYFNLLSQARWVHGDCRFTSPTAILHARGFRLPGNFEDWARFDSIYYMGTG
jgi:hypothetical protein